MQKKLNEVQQRLSEIDATKFHKMVDTYLNQKYNYDIHSTGTKTGEDKPRKGTPDTLIPLNNRKYIFVEYTTQKTNIKDKFLKEPIEIEEVINIANKSLVYGKAGIGKTTLCKYIAYKWAKGELYNEFEYMVYIPLREWKTGGIREAIKDYYYSQDEDSITFNIKENTKKIFFLFDGYDELV